MRYTVTWTAKALDQLAAVWLAAADRGAVARASNAIERRLRLDPESKGIDFYGDWLIAQSPLQVVYRIRTDDMLVEIHTVI